MMLLLYGAVRSAGRMSPDSIACTASMIIVVAYSMPKSLVLRTKW